MRAILIDPFAITITEIDIPYKDDGEGFKLFYPLLSHEIHPVDTFDVVRLQDGDAIFVDDNGLLNDPQRFFLLRGYDNPLAGKGLVMGSDDDGNTQPAKMALQWFTDNVRFAEVIPGTHTLIRAKSPWRGS